ncbi:MAG: hypothetical protein LAO08_13845 [Acidobacteriia bacterium]|nr:hypothetical protein [Terriglobia bacterium]
MDSQEKDELRGRLRDEALARRMGEALDRISASGAGECPDAAILATYYERALQPEEMEQWEGHFAGCPRCRKIMAVLAASIDTPLADAEVARLGELVAVAARPASGPAPLPAKVIKSTQFDWRARWLAPALGVAAVLAVWFAMRAPWHKPGQVPSETLVAQAPKSEPPLEQERNTRGLDQVSGVESKKAPGTSAATSQDRISETTAPASPAPESTATNSDVGRKSPNQLKAKVATPEMLSKNEKENPAGVARAVGGAIPPAAAPSPPPVAAPQRQAANGEQPATALNAEAMSNSPARDKQAVGGVAGAGVESAPRPAADMAKGAQKAQSFSMATGAASAGFIQVQAPSGKILWRAGAGGRIQQSADGGRTWIMQASPSPQEWLATAAISDTVCWLVGRNGSIARTTDGEHWLPIAPPVAAAGLSGRFPDWTGVTASSALAATVTSSDNQRYRTEDGGLTWRQQ